MGPIALFVFFVVIIAAVLFAVWRYWMNIARVSPEEEEFDEQMSALNDRQANRISDQILTRPLSDDDAWQVMVRRGKRLGAPKRRTRRDTAPRVAPRRERYGGELARRVEERRDRTSDSARLPGAALRRGDRGYDPNKE